MADVLVMNQSNGTDLWHYKTGMIVDIFDDGRLGPGTDQHPKFWVIRVPNATKEELAFLTDFQLSDEFEVDPVSNTTIDQKKPKGRRKDGFDTIKMSTPVRNELLANREITVPFTAAQIQTYITRFWPDD